MLGGKVPHAVVFGEDFFFGQKVQTFVTNDSASQLEITVHLGGLVRANHSLEGGEKSGGVLNERGEDELKSALLEAGSQVQSLGGALDQRIGLFDLSVENALVTNEEVDFLVLV